MPYGMELILDLHDCDPVTFTRESIGDFFKALCARIDMEPAEVFWWDDVGVPEADCQTEPHLKGTSAVQFITTSNITIHTLDLLGAVYLNVFSCKSFDPDAAIDMACQWFQGESVSVEVLTRR